MSLPELQQHFIAAIFDRSKRPLAAEHVRGHGELDAEQRVGIYCNSVHGILLQYLSSLYPVCQELVGEQFFERLSDEYVDAQPPTTPFLADYGGEFADFLLQHEALANMPWLADVARLERARQLAWNGINQAPSDFAQIASLDEQQQASLQFELPASMQLLTSVYATHQVWLAHQVEDYPEKLPLERIQIQQASYIVVWRVGRKLQQVLLDEMDWNFLTAIQQGSYLPALTARFQEALPTLLTNAIQRGWIISFTTTNR